MTYCDTCKTYTPKGETHIRYVDCQRELAALEDDPPSEHFGPTAQRYRYDQTSSMIDLYADCE